jgi:uncharacterized membrane protein YeiH
VNETIVGLDADTQRTLELIGLFVFALSGALLAVRKSYDVVGMAVLAFATACGGGIVRDVILGDTPPIAFRDLAYLLIPLAATVAVFIGHRAISTHLLGIGAVFDAAGLGLFCVTGTVKALEFGVRPAPAVALGVITAAGGGVLRDVLAQEPPAMFRADSVLFAIPAALGATLVALAWRGDWYSGFVGAGAALGVFLLRVSAIRFDWHAPRPRP